jgi:hypothetical protein
VAGFCERGNEPLASVRVLIIYRRMPSSGMWLQPPAHAGSSLADFSTLKMEAIPSSETSVHTRSTRRLIPKDGIVHSHRLENLISFISNRYLLIYCDVQTGTRDKINGV